MLSLTTSYKVSTLGKSYLTLLAHFALPVGLKSDEELAGVCGKVRDLYEHDHLKPGLLAGGRTGELERERERERSHER